MIFTSDLKMHIIYAHKNTEKDSILEVGYRLLIFKLNYYTYYLKKTYLNFAVIEWMVKK